jgi:hypothetical protein
MHIFYVYDIIVQAYTLCTLLDLLKYAFHLTRSHIFLHMRVFVLHIHIPVDTKLFRTTRYYPTTHYLS